MQDRPNPAPLPDESSGFCDQDFCDEQPAAPADVGNEVTTNESEGE